MMGVGALVLVLGIAGLVVDDAPASVAAPASTTFPASLPSTSRTSPSSTPASATSTTVALEEVAAFAADLAAALRTGDGDALDARLHPAVVALYGSEACRLALADVVEPDRDLTVTSSTGPADWDWVIDGRSIPVADVVTATLADGAQSHFGYVDGELRWFTDCGEPLT